MKQVFQFREFDLASEGNTLSLFFKRLLVVAAIFIVPLYVGLLTLALQTMPVFGYLLGGILLAYLPLVFKRGKPQVTIGKDFKVNYTPAKGLNADLLYRSLGSILLFCTMLIMAYFAFGDMIARSFK